MPAGLAHGHNSCDIWRKKRLDSWKIQLFSSEVELCHSGTSCNKSTECYYKDLKVKRYDGCVSTTASGISCQVWNIYLDESFPPFHARLGPLLSLTTTRTPIWAWKEITAALMITLGPGKDRWIIRFIPIYLENESELNETDGKSKFLNCEFKFQVLHNRSKQKVGRLPGSYLQRRWGKLLS